MDSLWRMCRENAVCGVGVFAGSVSTLCWWGLLGWAAFTILPTWAAVLTVLLIASCGLVAYSCAVVAGRCSQLEDA